MKNRTIAYNLCTGVRTYYVYAKIINVKTPSHNKIILKILVNHIKIPSIYLTDYNDYDCTVASMLKLLNTISTKFTNK